MLSFTEQNLVPGLPSEVDSLVTSASTLIGSTNSLLSAIQTLTSTGTALLLDNVNPLSLALSAAIGSLQGLIDGLTKANISWITVHPYVEGVGTYNPTLNVYTATPQKILEQMALKLDDMEDPDQPGFSDTAVAGGIVGIGVASSVSELTTLLNATNLFFDLPDLQFYTDLVTESQDSTAYDAALEPLWQPQELDSILPAYGLAMSKLKGFASALDQTTKGATEGGNFLVNKLSKKITQLTELQTTLTQMSSIFTAASAVSGFHWTSVAPAAGGIATLRSGLLNSNLASNESNLCFGFMGVGDLENLTMFQTLLGL